MSGRRFLATAAAAAQEGGGLRYRAMAVIGAGVMAEGFVRRFGLAAGFSPKLRIFDVSATRVAEMCTAHRGERVPPPHRSAPLQC